MGSHSSAPIGNSLRGNDSTAVQTSDDSSDVDI